MDLQSIVDSYNTLQQQQPLLGNMLTAAGVYPTADFLAQVFERRSVKSLNWRSIGYSLKLAPLYGAAIFGLVQSGEAVGKVIEHNDYLRSVYTGDWKSFAQGALGPNLWGNLTNVLFYYNGEVGKNSNHALGEPFSSYSKITQGPHKSRFRNIAHNIKENVPREAYLASVLGSITAWNAIQFANYKWVPEQLRSPFALACIVPWVAGMYYFPKLFEKMKKGIIEKNKQSS